MEKEINTEDSSFCLNFYYDEYDFSEKELTVYKNSLELLLGAFQKFKEEELKLKNFKLHLNITICTNEKIQQLNNDYRQKDKITDVLSFPLQEDIRNGEFDTFIPDLEIGDIYISLDVCQKQAKEFKISFQEEFIHLSTHGFLHLCGFDHEINQEEEKLMESLEEKIILSIRE